MDRILIYLLEYMDKIVVRSKKKLIEEICNVLKTDGNSADLNHIDTSRITDMSGLFWNSKFNGDISKWNVRNVKIMYDAFINSRFNGDLYDWNIENLENFSIFSYIGCLHLH